MLPEGTPLTVQFILLKPQKHQLNFRQQITCFRSSKCCEEIHNFIRSLHIRLIIISRDLIHDTNKPINFILFLACTTDQPSRKALLSLIIILQDLRLSCADIHQDGTLIGTAGFTSGSVVGLVMYDEGSYANLLC